MLDNLWRGKSNISNKVVNSVSAVHREPEVQEKWLEVLIEENVLRFYIPMKHMLRVEISQGSNQFLSEIPSDFFSKTPVLAHPIKQIASLNVGHGNNMGYGLLLALPPKRHVVCGLCDGNKSPPIQSF